MRKKLISLLLVMVLCSSLSIPAFAEYDYTSFAESQPRFISYITKYISSNAGIRITVHLTINDSNGDITGLQSAEIDMNNLPAGVTDPRIVSYSVYDDYILFSLTYKADGILQPDYAYCYSQYNTVDV